MHHQRIRRLPARLLIAPAVLALCATADAGATSDEDTVNGARDVLTTLHGAFLQRPMRVTEPEPIPAPQGSANAAAAPLSPPYRYDHAHR